VTIVGFNLGTVSEVYMVDPVLNVTLIMPAVYLVDHQTLTFTVPEWQGANLTLYVDVSDQTSTPILIFSYSPPVFTVTYGALPTSGGAPFQLRGSNFGRSPYAMVNGEPVLVAQVFVGGVPVQCNVDTWTDTFIECISPARQGKDVEVRLPPVGCTVCCDLASHGGCVCVGGGVLCVWGGGVWGPSQVAHSAYR
jgi:hypothetical protein